MIIHLDVNQLISGGIQAVFNGITLLLASRVVQRGLERIEKLNRNGKEDKKEDGGK